MAGPSATIKPFEPVAATLADDPMTQLTRIFVYFLQNLFRDFPEGCGMRWSPNEETSEILITGEKPRLDALERTPHITCILGAGRWGSVGMDQLQSLHIPSGERRHTDLMSMSMAYHCQAREGLVARRIAWNASFYTNVFRRLLMRSGGLHHVVQSHDMSPESGPTAYTGQLANEELVSVVVTVPFHWQPAWLIRDPAEVLKRLEVKVGPLKAHLVALPRIRGRRVQALSTPIDKAYDQTVVVCPSEEQE